MSLILNLSSGLAINRLNAPQRRRRDGASRDSNPHVVEVVRYLSLVGVTVIRRRPLDIRIHIPACLGRPVGVRVAVVIAYPPYFEKQVVGAVVLERLVEVEAEPFVRRGGDARRVAVINLERRFAVVVFGVRVGERR